MAHEIGHLIGLDHSQLDIDNSEMESPVPLDSTICKSATQDLYPLMYPFSCGKRPVCIRMISALYLRCIPYPTSPSFGQINGEFVDTAGTHTRREPLGREQRQW